VTIAGRRLSVAAVLVAQDIYFNMGEFGPPDELVRYVEWNTCAREAPFAVVMLWLVAIALAVVEYGRAPNSFSALVGYRPGRSCPSHYCCRSPALWRLSFWVCIARGLAICKL
jgi:hypothetical protein